MAEFCSCGSFIINSHCTNKNCNVKILGADHAPKATRTKAGTAAKKDPKKPSSRRSSKCITYNIDELDEKREESVE